MDKVDLWCGGPTQLLCIRREGNGYVLERKKPLEINAVISDLTAKDVEIKKSQRGIFQSSKRKRGRPN